jgi:hypothetical protein
MVGKNTEDIELVKDNKTGHINYINTKLYKLYHIQRQFSTGCEHAVSFFCTDIFELLVEQTDLRYQKCLYKQAGPSCLPAIIIARHD